MSNEGVRERHDQLAKTYDRRWSRYVNKTLGLLKSWAAIPHDSSVLDVGCGTGEFERLMLSEHPGQRMAGVDVADKMLEIARRKCQGYSNVSFLSASASELPFPDNSFDVVVSASALHYFDKPVVSLVEMRRVLKPQGCAIILDWCRDYLMCKLFDALFRRIETSYYRCYTQREFHHLLASVGLEIRSARKVRIDAVWGLMIATAVK